MRGGCEGLPAINTNVRVVLVGFVDSSAIEFGQKSAIVAKAANTQKAINRFMANGLVVKKCVALQA
jgi:hypothetical protein